MLKSETVIFERDNGGRGCCLRPTTDRRRPQRLGRVEERVGRALDVLADDALERAVEEGVADLIRDPRRATGRRHPRASDPAVGELHAILAHDVLQPFGDAAAGVRERAADLARLTHAEAAVHRDRLAHYVEAVALVHLVELVVALFGQVGPGFVLGEKVVGVVDFELRLWSSWCL